MNVGVIARADRGGLASQTYEAWRNLRAAKVYVVDMGNRHRGAPADLSMYDADWSTKVVGQWRKFDQNIHEFFDGLDIVYSAETVYHDNVFMHAKNAGVPIVIHANPELFHDSLKAANGLWAATDWELRRMPERTRHVPMPHVIDGVPYRPRTELATMFFTAGEAMEDRNGWETIEKTLPKLDFNGRLLIRVGGDQPPPPKKVGRITVEYLPAVGRYEEVIPEETDMLLIPRRYGGLCLPVMEAAARGIPAVMSNVAPQDRWESGAVLVNATVKKHVPMKGGIFPIHDVRPGDLAHVLNVLACSPAKIRTHSDHARAWAERYSWQNMLATWNNEFERVTERYEKHARR